jgi:hypothetical protein
LSSLQLSSLQLSSLQLSSLQLSSLQLSSLLLHLLPKTSLLGSVDLYQVDLSSQMEREEVSCP